jgi:hypothetical protein
LLVVACLQSSGLVDLEPVAVALGIDGSARWELALSTEDPDYAPDPRPPETRLSAVPRIHFQRPGALVLRHGASESG